MRALCAAIIVSAIFSSLASESTHAGFIYDESVSGDAPSAPPVDLGVLSFDVNAVRGLLDGGGDLPNDGPDENDTYRFTATGDWTFDVTGLKFGPTFDGLHAYLSDENGAFLTLSVVSSHSAYDLFGTRGAGTYEVGLVPKGNQGFALYTIGINVPSNSTSAVPEPTSMTLFGIGLLGAGVIVRRRQRVGHGITTADSAR
ncbi:MAG: PEP-CTERM sorting domain-containing protein [Fuerstiella sp.]